MPKLKIFTNYSINYKRNKRSHEIKYSAVHTADTDTVITITQI